MKNAGLEIALVGGGPSALFFIKNILDYNKPGFTITVFESTDRAGSGMPYSPAGAGPEHVTNVSANEIPALGETVREYIAKLPAGAVDFDITTSEFNDYKVMPRLFFGKYLEDQFKYYISEAKLRGIKVTLHTNQHVVDLINQPEKNKISVLLADKKSLEFDRVVICTGHVWPKIKEDKYHGYFESPYPPSKLMQKFNHPVCLRGGSLTAIDAIRTLACANGNFEKIAENRLQYFPHRESENFRIDMYIKDGLLPSVRFHLDNPQISKSTFLTKEQLEKHKNENEGFVSLDYVFEKDFKEEFLEKDPELYEEIKELNLEDFVRLIMKKRAEQDSFELFRQEYKEAEQSIKRAESIHWKELLTQFSFAVNAPAKYFSAEDRLRLDRVLMPLISLIIAFAPQSSCEQLFALQEAGRIKIISTKNYSDIEVIKNYGIICKYEDQAGNSKQESYLTFIDCIGQRRMRFEDFPFKSLRDSDDISCATLKFKSEKAALNEIENGNKDVIQHPDGSYLLIVRGIAVNDFFQIIDKKGNASHKLYCIAVPYINGCNPDYSGLDFCESASKSAAEQMIMG